MARLPTGNKLSVNFRALYAAETVRALLALKPAVAKRLMRYALSAGARIIAREAKDLAPRDTGLLKRSIGIRAVTYSSGVSVAIIGPRKGFKTTVSRRGRSQVANPAKYAHLLEFGHVMRNEKDGPELGRVKAYPFIGPAFRLSRVRATNAVKKNLAEGLARETAKLRTRRKK